MENEKLSKAFVKISYTNKAITMNIPYIPYIHGNFDYGK